MIDTHCHLSTEDYDNLEEIIANMENNIMITAGINDKTNQEVLDLSHKYPNIYGVIGIHPTEVELCSEKSLYWIESKLKDPKIVGIGEIGLDYHYDGIDKETQKKFFEEQLELARKYQKVVVIHSRDAIEDTYQIMNQYSDLKMVLHCYSSSLEMAQKFLKLNVLFGIGGVVTFQNSRVLKEVVAKLPLDHIVLETDSPYLTPEPYRGKKNEPKNVLLVAKKIAEIKGIEIEEVLKQTTLNAILKFGLKKTIS